MTHDTHAQVPASPLVPALAIPYELTSKIFLLCLPRYGRVRPTGETAPLLLAQICSHWRAVALSIPQLWTSIFLHFDRRVQYDGISSLFGVDSYPLPNTTVALVDLWFTRAAGFPLSITVTSLDSSLVLPHGLITAILAKSSQWGRLELLISKHDFQAFSHVAGPFPMLQSIAMEVVDYTSPLPWNRDLYLGAPNLHALRLGRALWREFPGQSDILSSSATAVEFWPEGSVTAEFFRPLNRFPNLRHLKIDTFFFRSTLTLIPAPRLETLIVSYRTWLLDHLQIPTLRHLDVSIHSEDHRWIISFVTRSACVLTDLRLRVTSASSRLSDCLAAVPTVINLALSCSEEQYALLHSAELLPRLQTLHLTSPASAAVYPAFLALLQARPSVRSAELRVISTATDNLPSPRDDVLAGVAALREDGMVIKLSHTYHRDRHEYEDAEEYDIFDPQNRLPHVFAPFEPRF
ncbi:F-box domain-containing protein [Mycena venus]|uniref:F-box domain-containing protein n=1 Tax=Mycena venus TaxID=2733690 RepID=A0A8H7CKX3_9AGAR|nr:F-box domain-containing protein [Mycena venus]